MDAATGAAAMIQALTAHYLTTSTFPLGAGDWCLVHAAAGGTGLLLCQMARIQGARVIGTVSTEAKSALAREAGAEVVVRYTEQDVAAEVRRVTGGVGVRVAYDSVGRTTWEASIDALRPRGMLVLFGQSSGAVPPIDPLVLMRKGSLFLTRPTVAHYVSRPEELQARAREIFQWIDEGRLRLRIDRSLPLAEAAEAHRALEGRGTSGKLLLVP
jgi:NADPH2:quinone reductase